ncbi:hypothetical protein ADK66_01775 [Micromonospora sp. NRRL B-16802]|uniref:hypothetical protein n=1 Tax=Micromonospora sp. NRRL B-16802 TaxID=1415541 RepID=UPI0006ADECB4|nr:hypothetical protein [Micromonospora sp. NRRL B-16802]KOX14835.1 hypothetical protein ADK66_01775 [Micromonospora sp. NRRL B-16802]
MSPPAAAPRPPRPGTVTIAFWLQLAVALILLGLAALAVAQAVHFDGQITRAARLVPDADPAEVASERQGNVLMALVVGVPAVLLAGWLAATAGPLRRGSNIARILVFAASGAQLLVCFGQCCSGFLVSMLVAPEIEAPSSADFDDEWETSKFLDTLYSGTDPLDELFFPMAGLSVLAVLALIGAVVLLLALPPAAGWFVPRPAPADAAPPSGYAVAPFIPAGYAYPPLPIVAQAPGVPGFLPPGQYVPAGYLICPDPAAHLTPTPPGTPDEPPTTPSTVPPATPGDTPDAEGS